MYLPLTRDMSGVEVSDADRELWTAPEAKSRLRAIQTLNHDDENRLDQIPTQALFAANFRSCETVTMESMLTY